jgi:hypothetical protein
MYLQEKFQMNFSSLNFIPSQMKNAIKCTAQLPLSYVQNQRDLKVSLGQGQIQKVFEVGIEIFPWLRDSIQIN